MTPLTHDPWCGSIIFHVILITHDPLLGTTSLVWPSLTHPPLFYHPLIAFLDHRSSVIKTPNTPVIANALKPLCKHHCHSCTSVESQHIYWNQIVRMSLSIFLCFYPKTITGMYNHCLLYSVCICIHWMFVIMLCIFNVCLCNNCCCYCYLVTANWKLTFLAFINMP